MVVEAPFVANRFTLVHHGTVRIDPKQFDHKQISIHTADKGDEVYAFAELVISKQTEDMAVKIDGRNQRMQEWGGD